jgi:phage-related protein
MRWPRSGKSEASTRQYVLRVNSLLGYAQRAGYTLFNAGATIKVALRCG